MPWSETTRMDQKRRLIEALESATYTMTELSEAFGIARKTAYKWAHRYANEGLAGLEERSRAPQTCPHKTEERCVEALLEERRRHPRWGARKILARLERRDPQWPWPAPSTAHEIFKRNGLVTPRRRQRRRGRPARPQPVARAPNDLWSADFKGEFRLGDRRLCYPLTAMDRATRYVLGCEGKDSVRGAEAFPSFEALFSEFGLPSGILCDTGAPFGSPRSPRRLSRLAVWWIKLGIEPLYIQPGHPEQNGGHERMHRTLKAETTRPPAQNMAAQQARFDAFRREFNEQRPHEALDLRYPAELYQPSPRALPRRTPEVEYPGHFEVRSVRRKGSIRWRGRQLFLSEVLTGERVGLEEVDEGLWSIYFGTVLLGRYDERDDAIELLP